MMGLTADALEPRIYVACLAAYNNGRLHGAWIAVDDDEDRMRSEVRAMLKGSPVAGAEEFAIHDHEDFGGLEIAEYADLAKVARIGAFVIEHGALGAAVLDHVGGNLDEAAETLGERYHGVYESLAECMRELTEETTQIPEALRYYIDWEAMARDARLNGDVFTIETAHDVVHVFWAR